MSFLKYMDSMAMGLAIVLFLYMLHAVSTATLRARHVFWFGATILTLVLVFAGTRDMKLSLNPFIATIAVLTAVLWAAGFLALFDARSRWMAYFVAYSTIATLTYAMTINQGGITAKVLLGPLFYLAAGPALLVLLIAPVLAWWKLRSSLHALWVPAGMVLVSLSTYYMKGVATEVIKMEADPAKSLVYTLLTGGLLCTMLGFLLTKSWLRGDSGSPADQGGQASAS